MNALRIPSLKDRIQAMMIDGLIIVGVMFLSTYLFEKIGSVSEVSRMYLFLFLFVIYDPLFTAFGGTLGHRATGLRVKRENEKQKNISIPAAIFRFLLKSLLGWVSFITVSINSKGKAIHDFASGSIVIYKNSSEELVKSVLEPASKNKDDEGILDQN